jgi:hypothetical protein
MQWQIISPQVTEAEEMQIYNPGGGHRNDVALLSYHQRLKNINSKQTQLLH